MPLFPGIFYVPTAKSLLFAFFRNTLHALESECATPPEPGSARREAHYGEDAETLTARRRLRVGC
jgi:hypothetical protein